MPDEPAPITQLVGSEVIAPRYPKVTPASPFSRRRMPPMALDPDAAEVKAAGGVVWRRAGDTIAIAVAHRPRYDDWSLPKGKLDEGESWEEGALREVWEETGMRCSLGEELEPVNYKDRKGRDKVVRYWLMEP